MKEQRSQRSYTRVFLMLAAAVAVLGSCNLLGQTTVVQPATISDCINGFSSAYMSKNYTILYQYFSTSTSDRGAMKDPTFWDTTNFYYTNHPTALSITKIDSTNDTVTATFSADASASPITVTITMQQDNGYWYILSLNDGYGDSIT